MMQLLYGGNMKDWLVTAKLFIYASHIDSVVVRCNTERKAKIFAAEKFRKAYPSVGDMITILKVEEKK